MALRFGLIGLGQHGRNAVLPAFYQPETVGVELTAVCDVSQQNLDAVDRPVEKYLSAAELIGQAPVDAVYVAVGCDCSFAIVMAALKAGKAVICEKPLAASVEEAQAIAREVERTGCLFAVNFETRYSNPVRILQRWISEDRFGKINAIHFDNMWDCHKSFSATAARRARLLALAGALDCGIHTFDQARYLLGGEWDSVNAVGAWFDEPCEPPPHISVVGTLTNGCMFSLNASLAFTANIEPRVILNNIYLAGTEGVAVIRSGADGGETVAELTSRTLCETVTLPLHGHTTDISLLLTEFAQVAANGPDTPHTFAGVEDGCQAQLAMELAIRDAKSKRRK